MGVFSFNQFLCDSIIFEMCRAAQSLSNMNWSSRIEKKETHNTYTHIAADTRATEQGMSRGRGRERKRERKGRDRIKENNTEHTDIDQQIQCAYNDYMATERTSELIKMSNGLLNRFLCSVAGAASILFVCLYHFVATILSIQLIVHNSHSCCCSIHVYFMFTWY